MKRKRNKVIGSYVEINKTKEIGIVRNRLYSDRYWIETNKYLDVYWRYQFRLLSDDETMVEML